MTNRLVDETSPYLLQHADNPVDWYPWGEEALKTAVSSDRPIFLSIGYAACHWCHVMAHESFEDSETAALMNERFVNVKVDREERPDLDSIYMSAVVAMTKQGGWPMSVFLTPDGRPFWGGTYFPPSPRFGMPSFRQVLLSISDAWRNQREKLLEGADELTRHIGRRADLSGDVQHLDRGMLDKAVGQLAIAFDKLMGGFGSAPKFPPSMTLEFLLRYHAMTGNDQALHMVTHTLSMMARGGIYDQIGGGFSRYSVDKNWLVPHFEKMLYDNALLARVYLHAWQVTGANMYRRIVEETLDWAVREMRHDDGGFHSSLDADSEGEEGRFYVWQPAEIEDVVPEDAELVQRYYDISERGNWEGKSIPHVPQAIEEVAAQHGLEANDAMARVAAAREKLYRARALRVWPARDDKVLTSWNGLMLAAFAEAARVLDRPDYLEVAEKNARFLYRTMRKPDGRLQRTWNNGSPAKYNGYLEDYAYLAEGLLALYQSNFNEEWYLWACELAEHMVQRFGDSEAGGFYDTSDDHQELLFRPKDLQDNATPSGNAMAASVLLQIAMFEGDGDRRALAERQIAALYGGMSQHPTAFGHWLGGASVALSQPMEVAIVGDPEAADTQDLLAVLRARYRPFVVVAAGQERSSVALLRERGQTNGQATAYVCRQFVCRLPVTTDLALQEQLGDSP